MLIALAERLNQFALISFSFCDLVICVLSSLIMLWNNLLITSIINCLASRSIKYANIHSTTLKLYNAITCPFYKILSIGQCFEPNTSISCITIVIGNSGGHEISLLRALQFCKPKSFLALKSISLVCMTIIAFKAFARCTCVFSLIACLGVCCLSIFYSVGWY